MSNDYQSHNDVMLKRTHDRLAVIAAGEIAPLFIDGVKITIIVRDPACDTAGHIITNDTKAEIAAQLDRFKELP